MEILNIPLNQIKEYKKNPKSHPKEQIIKIANSIREFGFNVPVLLDKDNILIAGHGRYLAAKELNLKEIPTIKIENLNPEQIKAYRIADNRLTESDWEYDFLAQEITDLKDAGFELDYLGFSDKELNKLMPQKEAVEDEFDVSKALKEPKYKVKRGDLFGLGAYITIDGKEVDVEVLE